MKLFSEMEENVLHNMLPSRAKINNTYWGNCAWRSLRRWSLKYTSCKTSFPYPWGHSIWSVSLLWKVLVAIVGSRMLCLRYLDILTTIRFSMKGHPNLQEPYGVTTAEDCCTDQRFDPCVLLFWSAGPVMLCRTLSTAQAWLLFDNRLGFEGPETYVRCTQIWVRSLGTFL